ncbi:MAG: DUF4180 domain-containing protein [Acidobacteria bacterium]|nr:DUF4180 domain-containing protein [Acidobacteriota bacterium]
MTRRMELRMVEEGGAPLRGNPHRRVFDLSSGEAGAVLQKLRNYRVRLAVA